MILSRLPANPWRSGVTVEVTAPRLNLHAGGLVVVQATGYPPDAVLSRLSGTATFLVLMGLMLAPRLS